MKTQILKLIGPYSNSPSVLTPEGLLKQLLEKIAQSTKAAAKSFADGIRRGQEIDERIVKAKDEWRRHNPYFIRGFI